MTHNKFYLILTEDEVEDRFFTKDLAIKDAKQLSIQENKTVYFMECTKVFDVEVNLKETSFEETTEESSDVEPKFKVGDIVNVFDNFTQTTVLCTVEEVIVVNSDIYYEVKNNLGTDIKPESCLTLAQPSPNEVAKHEFKVGDIVKYNFSRYQEGVVTEATPEKIKVEIFDGTWLIDHNSETFFTLVQRK